jgi:hypothetical protein
MDKYLVKNTTREEREKIVRDSLSACGASCEGCNGCDGLGGGDPWEMYRPYIDGLKEISQINAEYYAHYINH